MRQREREKEKEKKRERKSAIIIQYDETLSPEI